MSASKPPLTVTLVASVLAFALAAAGVARADEGLWTFDKIPVDRIERATGVTLRKPWLDAAQAAAVRLTNGCSAAVVSAQGLTATNSHCATDCVRLAPGAAGGEAAFLTDARDEEIRCPGLQAEILLKITDVTDQVRAATEGLTGRDYLRARDSAMAVAELAACGQDPTLRCQALSFFRGAQYKAYTYRRYDDVRLVFAPETAASAFGGDPDNFNFPRYAFDVAFLRLYVDGQAAATPAFLRWRTAPPSVGEPTFVVGNPGSTERQLTVSQLETQRDVVLPFTQLSRSEVRGRLLQLGQDVPDQRRAAEQALAWVENGYKVGLGKQRMLNDAAFMQAKRAEEVTLRARIDADPKLSAEVGRAWEIIDKAQDAACETFAAARLLDSGAGGGSELFYAARLLVRAGIEREKPNAERLPDYVDTRLPQIERRLADLPAFEPRLEQLYLEHWLLKVREHLGVDAPETRALLGVDSPQRLAAHLAQSELRDPATRVALWKGGLAALQASDDPLVQLLLRMEPSARAARAVYDARVTAPVDQAAEAIARARFALLGDSVYPDATFSLRLSYGRVEGWRENGRTIDAQTRFGGLYQRATGAAPFVLAERWSAARERLSASAVFNFSSTNDIVGGNSGSPVLDAEGRVMGLAFDGNSHSPGGAYGYDGALNRTVSVAASAVLEALDKVYGRAGLVRELTGRRGAGLIDKRGTIARH